jgi:ABC-type antimicrobial peptide transport system permease subunit
MLTAFASSALILAVIGVYGLTAYTVGQRRHEIGVRMALGARPGQVLGSVLARGTRLAAVSVLIGVAGALALTRWLESFLFEISTTDMTTFMGAGLVLGAGAIVASYRPARAASRTDPATVLRCE